MKVPQGAVQRGKHFGAEGGGGKERRITSPPFRDERVYVADAFIGADEKIPAWPVKTTYLGKVRTAINLVIKSWSGDVGLAQATYFGPVVSFLTSENLRVLKIKPLDFIQQKQCDQTRHICGLEFVLGPSVSGLGKTCFVNKAYTEVLPLRWGSESHQRKAM